MSEPKIVPPDEARKLAADATGGPWCWRNSSGHVYLQGVRTRIAMAFERFGMQGAQPSFRNAEGILAPAGKANINEFGDARLIAAAPDLAHTAAVLGEQREAVLAFHKGVHLCPSRIGDRKVMRFGGPLGPCPTARALGVAD